MTGSPAKPLSFRYWRLAISRAVVAALTVGLLGACGDGARGQRPDVRYEPSAPAVVEAMLNIAEVQPDDLVYDLGSGDGRIVIAAARDFGVERAIGVDIDPERIAEARENAREAGVADQVTFIQADLFSYDFSDADAVMLYLLPRLNIKLRPRLLEELSPGTRVVSHSHDMNDWRADEHVRVRGDDVYLWIIPADVAGHWRLESPAGTFELDLSQRFQDVTGTLEIGGRGTRILSAELDGTHLEFTARPVRNDEEVEIRVSGDVTGETFEGTLHLDGETHPVSGRRGG